MSEKKYDCGLIQDLLPLYHDGICSEESRQAVKEHLETCSECSKIATELDNYEVDEKLSLEKNMILRNHEKKENRRTFKIGIVTACIFMIPLIICLICNLAIEHELDWFFVVLTSLLVTASISVVPLLVPERKAFFTIISFTSSLLLLLATCCIYTGGDWFFVAAASCILGLSLLFAPYLMKQLPLPKILKHHKGAIVLLWDTIWLYLLIFISGYFVQGDHSYWNIALPVTTYCVLFTWVIFLIARYLKINFFIKSAVIVFLSGVATAFSNDVLKTVFGLETEDSLLRADFSSGISNMQSEVMNANVMIIILISCVVASTILLAIGLCNRKKSC